MEACEHHGELMGAVEEQKAYSKIHHESIVKLFDKIDSIKTAVDQNEVRATGRDERLTEIKDITKATADKWEGFNDIIESMNDNMRRLSESVMSMGACLERRKIEREKRIAEEQEFTVWTKTGKTIARSINRLVERNILMLIFFIIFFILWLLYGGDGNILPHIHATLDSIVGW